jgi:hypothetical protein
MRAFIPAAMANGCKGVFLSQKNQIKGTAETVPFIQKLNKCLVSD